MAKRRWGGVIAACLALMCAVAIGLPVQTAYAAEGNLALGKTAVADSEEAASVAARFAVDGDTTSKNSRWGSNVDSNHGEHWIYVDLGEDTEISSVKVFWENRKATGFKIQTAAAAGAKGSDSTAWGWEDAYATDQRPEATTSTVNFEPVTARYVRLLITGFTPEDPDGVSPTYATVSIYELEVYGEKQETPVEATNLALKKPTKASADHNNEDGARAVDGKKDDGKKDRWMTEAQPVQWLRVDLGQEETVKHLVIQWENAENYATSFSVYASSDESVWSAEGDNYKNWGSPIVNEENNTKGINEITLETPVSARYLLLRVSGMSTVYGVSCMEFEAWNDVPPAPEKQPADYLDDIAIAPVTASSTELEYTIPEDVPEGYTISYNGTDYEQVIDLDGTIYHPISDVTVKASFKLTNDSDNTDYAFKEFEVAVPGTMEPTGDNAAPSILPELREWVGGTGSFQAGTASRVVYGHDSLKTMAEEFATDYALITGVSLDVVSGTSAQTGDIFFTLGAKKSQGLQDEGYLLEAASDRITVTAEAVAGANWGGKTILQGMKTGNNSFPVGTTRDYPLYRVRGLILDVGRKTFTLDWLKAMTKQMAYFKMNDFQIHLNDNLIGLGNVADPMKAYSGFRLESSIKKGGNNGLNQADLTSTDVWYSKADFKEYIEHSKDLGVNIIPEIDTPAHSLALTKVRPDLRYGTNGTQNDHLDLRGEKFDQSIDFVQSIFDEYVLGGDSATFAGAEVIHIGADEYNVGTNAESSPLYRKFVNEMFDYAYENGHTPRVWGSLTQYTQGDPIHVGGTDGKPRAQINLWNWGYANMDKMYEIGFDLIDCNDGDFYIVPNAGYYYNYLNNENCYNNALNSIGGVSIPAGDPQVAGGAFAVWNDMTDYLENGVSEYDVYDRIAAAMGLFAANSWGKGDLAFDDAEALAGELGDAPSANFGYEAEADDNGMYAQWNMDSFEDSSKMDRDLEDGKNAAIAEVDGRNALELKGSESYVSVKDDALTTIGLGSDLRVKVKRTDAEVKDQVLFESEYGQIKAVQGDTGNVGISRENRDYSFNFSLPVGEWVELEFKNEFTQTHLYVNGAYVETIGDDDVAAEGKKLLGTNMFPVNRIGSAEDAFVGYVDDVRVSVAPEDEFNSTMVLDHAVLNAEAVLASGQEIKGLEELIDQAYALFTNPNPSGSEVDNLVAAINALLVDEDGKPVYELADYTAFLMYEGIFGFDGADVLFGHYTDETLSPLYYAVELARRDVPASMQSVVDGYVGAMENALDGLKLKDGADLNFIDDSTLTATASDYQHDGSDPKNVLDNNPATMWHSDWKIVEGEHWLQLTSDSAMSVDGVSYTPRQTGVNGNMQKYRIEVSTDGKTFKEVKSGDLTVSGTDPIVIEFDRQDNVKAVKVVWVKGVNGNAAAAELHLLNANAAPDFESLSSILEHAVTIKKSVGDVAFTDETWNAFQEQVKAAQDCVDNQTGDVNSVYDLRCSLAESMMNLRIGKSTVDPDPEPEPKEFKVTFDDRIPGNEDKVEKVKEGDKLTAPAEPELDGWKFAGWFTDGFEGGFKNEWNFDTDVVTGDITLTAKWVKDSDTPVDPDDPNKPVDPDKPGKPGDTKPPVDPEDPAKPGKPGTDLPQTGDDSMLPVIGLAVAAAVVIVGGVILYRRGKQ